MIELKNVSYSVNDDNNNVDIINDVSLTIDERFVAITGPNGGGKSTLAKLIAGIIKPTKGNIYLDGKDITDASITERADLGISYAFQQPVRFKGITVMDLIKLAAGKDISVNGACDYLSQVGLCARDYINREVNASLSGGEIKRRDSTISIDRSRKLTVIDQQGTGHESGCFKNLIEALEKMHEKIIGSIIIISHQERILDIADKIVVISGGKNAAQGTKEEILPEVLKGTGNCKFYDKKEC